MVLRVNARPLTFVCHLLAIAATVMVLVWCIHFRGGLAFKATNKSLIFNIHPVVMLIGFIILGGEAIISYKAFPWRKKVKKVIHLTLHFFTLILGIVGIYAAFKYHSESGIIACILGLELQPSAYTEFSTSTHSKQLMLATSRQRLQLGVLIGSYLVQSDPVQYVFITNGSGSIQSNEYFGSF
uniref:Cytochrome b561 domain-containing protein n=1 Tax=Nelumbo nucifera TaxID=4432 RepID=A0A822ZRB6_NELNU|nr:TPA_asm: hypothetical protein HUJ06_017364 [Nelumbo nucifera]